VENILFLILDSCRFDTFKEANPGNFLRVGTLHKVYSPGCWTLATIPTYVHGVPPLGYPEPVIRRYIWGWDSIRDEKVFWAFLTPNPLMLYYANFFHNWDLVKGTEYPLHAGAKEIFRDVRKIMKRKRKFAIFTLLMETHAPMFDGKRHYKKQSREEQWNGQVAAIKYVDSLFGQLWKFIPDGTKIVITSDHGELMGERNEDGNEMWGHDPRNAYLDFHVKLFEIPYIEGWKDDEG